MLYMATGHLGCKFLSDVSVVNSPIVVELLVITALYCVVLPAEWRYLLLTQLTKTYNLSEPAYLWPYTAYVLLMMGEIVARNM